MRVATLDHVAIMTIPATAQAAVMTAFQRPIEIREFPVPVDLGPGDVLVRVTLAGVCGTDVHQHQGELAVPLPLIHGHETAGVVAATGGDCIDWLGSSLSVGDAVSWTVGLDPRITI